MPKSTMTTIGIRVDELSRSHLLIQGMPWIHENGVVPSTFHQCLKFYQEGVKVIQGDTKPFTETESHFANAKFYMDEDMVPEALPK
ncbi:hypothetical protein ACFX2B_012839 [Malus domestica]